MLAVVVVEPILQAVEMQSAEQAAAELDIEQEQQPQLVSQIPAAVAVVAVVQVQQVMDHQRLAVLE
jgi:hypothetical protein